MKLSHLAPLAIAASAAVGLALGPLDHDGHEAKMHRASIGRAVIPDSPWSAEYRRCAAFRHPH